jgi:hypothetical protein
MAMYKKATFSHKCKVTALNSPKGKGWDIFNLPNQIKTASTIVESEDLNGFDLKQATSEHPDHLYIKIFAIKKDEPNDNGDAFSEEELKTAAGTFVGVPLFTNHQNDDVEKARGECVHSWYDEKEGGIFIIGRVDKIAYPRLARGIEEGYIASTSMGCSVESSICSVCHNKAHTAEDYCVHIANRKNRKYTGDIKCAYHNSPVDTDEKCPVCGSTKNDIKTLKLADQPIYEHNYGLKFIENSFVVNPACHDCGVKCVLNTPALTKKVASLSEQVDNLVKESYLDEGLAKVAGVQELDSLKQSMTEMESVVKSMLMQKENVSMEYVSDLVKAMSDVQNIFDELVEMGYGGLPSPKVAAEGTPVVTEQFPTPVPPQNLAPPSPPPQPSQGAGVQTSDLGGLGNVTMPKKSSRNKEDFSQINKNVINKISSLIESLSNLNENINSQLEIGAKMATDNKTTKTAAGSENFEVITEKQLMKQEETLHPRTGESYEGITESKEQLAGGEKSNDTTSDSPQVRKGTYDTTTEDQLKAQSALGDAVIHYNDYPDVITEKQWNEFSRDIASDVVEDYTEQITQAQIRDLLSSHKFIGNVETITEDQLRNMSMTDGLKRWANKAYTVSLVKTATSILTDMISVYHKSPSEIMRIASMVSDDAETRAKVAFLSVVNSIPRKRESRESLASKAEYFSKSASKDVVSTIDALILSASKHGDFGMKAEDVIDFVAQAAGSKTAMAKVEAKVMEKKSSEKIDKVITKAAAFDGALKELDKPEDGLYRIKATMEDIGVPITNKVAFLNGVKKFAQEMIDDDSVVSAIIKLEVSEDGSLIIDIQDGGESEITPEDIGEAIEGPIEAIDADLNGEDGGEIPFLGNGGECPFDDNDIPEEDEDEDDEEEDEYEEDEEDIEEDSDCTAKTDSTKNKLAAAKKEIKKAQLMGGEMGGMGGASQAPGAGASMPQAPAMDTPPIGNLSEEEGFEDEAEGDFEDNLEPLPPGSICPVCGSDDVDIIGGKGKCNNCSSEMTYKVEVNVTKWQGITPSEEQKEAEEEGFEGEGFEMPEEDLGISGGAGDMGGQEMGEFPAAASVDNWKMNKFAAVMRLTPAAIKKASDMGIQVGQVSPATGTTNTMKLEDGTRVCLDTGTKYKVSYMVSTDGKQVHAQWEWEPKIVKASCPSCKRAKQRFVKALASINMKESDFDALDFQDQVETVFNLKKAGALNNTIKTASKEGSVIEDYKLAYGNYGNSFPIESCIEKLSRRFGKDAICLSGPDEGKPLAISVCNRLKKADIYSSNIAIKVAEAWEDCDGDEQCITHLVRKGKSLRQAAEACSVLKIAIAEGEEFLADELAEDDTFDENPVEEPLDEDFAVDEIDPFETEVEEAGTVTLELPIDIVEQLDAKLDVALGENPAEEEHHDDMTSGEDMGGLPVEDITEESPIEESPIEESPIEEGVDETIAPEEFNNNMKPSLEPEGGEISSATDIGGNAPFEEELQKNKGVSESPQKQVILKQDGVPVTAESLIENKIGKVGKSTIDLSGVIEALNKSADKKEIVQEKAQDSKDIGQYTAGENGSLMGHENETIRTPGKPSVPRNNATMGKEDADLNPQDKPQPSIPSGDATIGHEKEVGLDGGDNRYTGGDKGQGKTELAKNKSSKKIANYDPFGRDPDISDEETIQGKFRSMPRESESEHLSRVLSLAEETMTRLIEENAPQEIIEMQKNVINKLKAGDNPYGGDYGRNNFASTDEDLYHMRGFGTNKAGLSSLAERIAKKLQPKEPVSKDSDIQPISDGGTIGKEEKFTAEDPTNVEGGATESLIGHESETIGKAPKEPADQPYVATGNAQMGKEDNDSEKTTKVKGTVIAESDSESEAIRVAGLMLQARKIEASELPTKVRELKEYKPAQIRDIEKAIFASEKGLNTVEDGKLSQSVQINEASSIRNAKDELSSKIQGLFSLSSQNEMAQADPLTQIRKTYGK